MTLLAVLLILFVLIGYGLKEYYQIKIGPPTTTPLDVRDEIVALLNELTPAGRVIDLGFGWGTFVLDLAKRLPDWQIDGLEAAPTPWFIANCRSIGSRLTNYRFFIGRMEQQALQNYDLIYINQPARNILPMMPRLMRCLQSDTFIISYPNPLPRLPAGDMFRTARNDRFYLYRGIDAINVPAPENTMAPQPERIVEPAQEPVAPPAARMETTADNAFEPNPVTDVPPAHADFPENAPTVSETVTSDPASQTPDLPGLDLPPPAAPQDEQLPRPAATD